MSFAGVRRSIPIPARRANDFKMVSSIVNRSTLRQLSHHVNHVITCSDPVRSGTLGESSAQRGYAEPTEPHAAGERYAFDSLRHLLSEWCSFVTDRDLLDGAQPRPRR